MEMILFVGFYVSYLLFAGGYLWRIVTWSRGRTAPVGTMSLPAFLRALADILLLRRLMRSNDVLWLGEWVFHVSFLVVLLSHLRFWLEPVPGVIVLLRVPGIVAGWVLAASLVYIVLMKTVIERRKYFSTYNFFLVALLLATGASGLLVRYLFRVDVTGVKDFVLGLERFQVVPFPAGTVFLLHFIGFLVFLAGLPSHIFAAPLTMIEAQRREEELPLLLHEK